MELYYKTPKYNNSYFMWHLVEHLLLHPKDKNNIKEFMYRNDISWRAAVEHIYIIYDQFLFDKWSIKNYLNTKISQEILDYEYNIFEEEFANNDITIKWWRVMDKFYKKRYDEFLWSKPVLYNLEEVNKYILDNIENWKYLLFDKNENKIESTNIEYKKIKFTNYIEEINRSKILLEWKINYIEYKKISSWFDFLVMNFLCDLLDVCDRLEKRYNLWSYFLNTSYIYNNSECISIWNRSDTSSLSKDLFDEYKNYYIKYIQNNKLEFVNVYSVIYKWEYISKEEMIKCIKDLDYEYARKLK